MQIPSVLLLLLSASLGVFQVKSTPALVWEFEAETFLQTRQEAPEVSTVFEYVSRDGAAHAPAIRLNSDGFSIIWFDGTRESHEDVIIKQARFTNSNGGWLHTPPQTFLTKEDLSQATVPRQTILSLGNTIQYGTDENRVLATIVSIGGWAAASIALVDLENDLPISVRKLSLSPFSNRSHLVRGPTVSYQDGSIAIPAYLELGNVFGELVRLDHHGHVRDKRRMSQGRFAIQPAIVPFDAANAVALMRNYDTESDRLIASWTSDGGRNWSQATLLDVPNPNAPVAALSLGPNELLMAFNDSPINAKTMSLALSRDQGLTWETVRTIEADGGDLRYPAMSRLPDGDILLTFSIMSKHGIKAIVFNEAWVFAE